MSTLLNTTKTISADLSQPSALKGKSMDINGKVVEVVMAAATVEVVVLIEMAVVIVLVGVILGYY